MKKFLTILGLILVAGVCSAATSEIDQKLLNASYEDLQAVVQLVAQGANVNVADDYMGNTPLMVAAFNEKNDIATFLISKGADVNKKNSLNETALMIAAQKGNAELVTILLKYGADIKATDINGHSAAERASISGQDKIAKLLTPADQITSSTGATTPYPNPTKPEMQPDAPWKKFGRVIKEPWFPPTIDQIPLPIGASRNAEEEHLFAKEFANEKLFYRKLIEVRIYTIAKPIEELAEYYLPVFNTPTGWLTGEEFGWIKYDENGMRDFSLEGSYILVTPIAIPYKDQADILLSQKIRKPITCVTGEKLWMERFDLSCLTQQTKGNRDAGKEILLHLTDLSLSKKVSTPLTQIKIVYLEFDHNLDPVKRLAGGN